jgi:hypothetical protein
MDRKIKQDLTLLAADYFAVSKTDAKFIFRGEKKKQINFPRAKFVQSSL